MKPVLVHVLTVADSLIFIDTVVETARRDGFDVTVVTSPDPRLEAFGQRLGVRTVGVDMPRRVSPLGDWNSALRLRALFEQLRPDIVHAGTPKGGLLGMLGAAAAKVPTRLYQMRGLPFVTATGVLRGVLKTTEQVACASATAVLCQSHSLRRQALEERLVSADKSQVLLEGSNGVSLARFDPAVHADAGRGLRRSRSIPDGALVFGFVGRLVRDKGIPELVEAFSRLDPSVHLLVAGTFEPRDPVDAATRAKLETMPTVHLLGHQSPEALYAAADVIVLPSHREGFPNVPLEAAAMGKPVISTTVPGCIDAVEDGVTGLLVPPADANALEGALRRYATDTGLRQAHGVAGRRRAESRFDRRRIAEAMVALYRSFLASN